MRAAPWAQPGVARGKTGSGQESGQYTNVKISGPSTNFAPGRDVQMSASLYEGLGVLGLFA